MDARRLSKEYRRSKPRNQAIDSFLYKVEPLIRGMSSLLLCFLIFGDLSLFRYRYINSGRGFILVQYSRWNWWWQRLHRTRCVDALHVNLFRDMPRILVFWYFGIVHADRIVSLNSDGELDGWISSIQSIAPEPCRTRAFIWLDIFLFNDFFLNEKYKVQRKYVNVDFILFFPNKKSTLIVKFNIWRFLGMTSVECQGVLEACGPVTSH